MSTTSLLGFHSQDTLITAGAGAGADEGGLVPFLAAARLNASNQVPPLASNTTAGAGLLAPRFAWCLRACLV